MNKTLGLQALSIFFVISSIVGCGGSNNDSGSTVSRSETETEIKSNFAGIAYAMYTDSLSTADELKNAVSAFLDEPTEANLDLAKAAYKAARIPYQQSEILRWDTDITLNSNTGNSGIASVDEWEGQINAWPLAEGLIDYVELSSNGNANQTTNIIASDEDITAEFLISQNGVNNDEANVATGIHAIEFLLWGQDTNATSPGSGSRPATDYDIDNCTNDNCDRRADYLRVASQLLVKDLTDMVAEWNPDALQIEGTLGNNFMNSNDGLAYMIGSMKIMSDDELASARMGTALETGDPEEEHDCFSDLSHVAIYYNFQGIRNAFYGRYNTLSGTQISGTSLSDLLKQISINQYEIIDSKMNDIEERMAMILADGESIESPLRFDEVIGRGVGDPAFDNANAASLELIALGIEMNLAREALSLTELNTDGGGDGD